MALGTDVLNSTSPTATNEQTAAHVMATSAGCVESRGSESVTFAAMTSTPQAMAPRGTPRPIMPPVSDRDVMARKPPGQNLPGPLRRYAGVEVGVAVERPHPEDRCFVPPMRHRLRSAPA